MPLGIRGDCLINPFGCVPGNDNVLVIGAGPSGLSAAISVVLNRNANVYVAEQYTIRTKHVVCSGLLSNNFNNIAARFGVDLRNARIWPIYGAVVDILGTKFVFFRGDAKRPEAYVYNRKELDYAFYSRASDLGVRFYFNCRVRPPFGFKYVVAADGPNSSTAKYLSMPPIPRYVVAGKFMARHSIDPRFVYLFIDPRISPGFFSWIIPHNEEVAEYGTGVDPKYGMNVSHALSTFAKKVGVLNSGTAFSKSTSFSGVSKLNPEYALIPVSLRPKMSYSNKNLNVLFVGDAAGHVKASTGGGIVFGTNMGELAGMFYDDPFRYEATFAFKYWKYLAMHNMLNRLFHLSPDNLQWISKRMKSFGVESFLSECGDMDFVIAHNFGSKYRAVFNAFFHTLGKVIFW